MQRNAQKLHLEVQQCGEERENKDGIMKLSPFFFFFLEIDLLTFKVLSKNEHLAVP